MSKMSEEQLCRGSVALGFIKYIKKTWGKEGLDQFTADSGMDISNIKESQWYDVQDAGIVQEWISKNKGEEHVIKAASYSLKNQGVFSYIIRFANIKSILKRAPANHKDVFKCGTMDVDMEENSARVIMKDTAVNDYSCLAWKGVFIGGLELTRTKGTVKETQCQLKDGASHCEFLIEWV